MFLQSIPSWGLEFPEDPGILAGILVQSDPAEACTNLTNAAEIYGKIAFLRRGGCFLQTKAQFAAQAGAIATVIYNS